jgi:branched-subunit amino acid aminotransferase/4-amino-4-deoxychorismate lyase
LEPLPELHVDAVQVEIIPGSRAHVEAKDSEWIRFDDLIGRLIQCRYKTNILKMASPLSNEVLLVDKNFNIYEGLSSNLFVVKDNTIYTAGKGIIFGTIRNIVLEACKELNFKVELQPPKLNEISEWKEAFLTSKLQLHFCSCYSRYQ